MTFKLSMINFGSRKILYMHGYTGQVVRTGKRNPDYITPYVKALLAKRNRLRKQGKNAAADNLTNVINQAIVYNLHNRLRMLANAPIKEMWSALALII